MKIPKQLNFIDLFSGAGGFSCGLEQAGMQCLLGVDYDKYAIETFAHNHSNAQTYLGDIRNLKKKEFEELIEYKPVHVIVGGPPCQGFSTVGTGNPKDERNHLFTHYLRIVRYCRPYFIVIENVTGLLANKNTDTLHKILNKLSALGYKLDFGVLSSENYGVPEKRRRTIIIGSRINELVSLPLPLKKSEKTVGDVLKEIKLSKGAISNHNIETAQLANPIDLKRLKCIPEGQGIRYEKDELKYLPKALRLGVNWDKLPENRFRQTKYQRLDRKRPSPTIMTHRGNYFHPTENRYLTAREAALIQSFPMEFSFKGPLSAQWRQIGNAVPPQLALQIAKHIKKMARNANPDLIDVKRRMKIPLDKVKSQRSQAFHYR